jgi:hypothetical protein
VKELGKELKSDPYGDVRAMTSSDAEVDLDLKRLGFNMERRIALIARREQGRAYGCAKREQEHIRAKIAEARASARGGAIGTSRALMQLWTPSDNNAAQRFAFNPNGTISTRGASASTSSGAAARTGLRCGSGTATVCNGSTGG